MNIYSCILIFSVLWWIVLFVVLPIGVRMDPHPLPGIATSAPIQSHIFLKLKITTAITIPLFFLIKWVIESDFISL